MNLQTAAEYCLKKSAVWEDHPFGPEVSVMKVASKMFALFSHREGRDNLSLKCEPELAEVLRRQYTSVTPGYYLNKRHWNTLILDGTIPEQEIKEWIDLSYQLVVKSLTRDEKAKLALIDKCKAK